MKEKYRYVGQVSQVGDVQFDRIGQIIELDRTSFEDVVRGGAAFVSEDLFASLAFTEENLSVHADPLYFGEVPLTYSRKVMDAREAFIKLKTDIDAGVTA